LHQSEIQKKAERKKTLLYISGVGMGVGSELIALAAIGLWLGKIIDLKWNFAPYGTLASVLIFLGSGLTHIVFILIKMQKKLEKLGEDKDNSVL
jgi:F0F1-type ATP synthase assembly protein I